VLVSHLSSFAASALRSAGHKVRALFPHLSANREFPAHWRTWLRESVPLTTRLPESLRQRHEALVLEFIAKKPFLGCAGFEVTEEVRVVVAGHACLLILARGLGAYAHVRQILMYPGEFAARRSAIGMDGVVQEHVQVMHGESSSLGHVVLSWADIQHPGDAGHNLVVHEFAHQLDQAKGAANGAPFTVASKARRERWAEVMSREFRQHQVNAQFGEQTLLSHYGATNPSEFFAVCAEVFFELPQAMKYVHPSLYGELKSYFRLDPADWFGSIA
jgi:Mlc titration factor MtfA (ptsG expression regulator)